jgi:peptidoglycan/xylan/chitin deacetylase (PgdA/CDA1 family)
VRALVKRALATAAAATGAAAALRIARRLRHGPAVRIFGYHRVLPDPRRATGMAPLVVSTATFANHLEHLARCYEVWPLQRAADALAGRRPMPRRDVAVITFDDGYRDVAEHAAPLLGARGLPATMFVTTGVVDGARRLAHDEVYALLARVRAAGTRLLAVVPPPSPEARWALLRADYALGRGELMPAADALLSGLTLDALDALVLALAAAVGRPADDELAPTLGWDELRRLDALGWTIGAHTVSHAHLPLEDDRVLAAELCGSRAALGAHLGEMPRAIAYPAGRHDARVLAAARAAGFTIGLTTEARDNHAGIDPLRLGRKTLSDGHGGDPAMIAAQLDGLFAAVGLSRPAPGDTTSEVPWMP